MMRELTLTVPLTVTWPFVALPSPLPETPAPGLPPNAASTVPSFGNHSASGAPAVFVVLQFCVVFTSQVPVPASALLASQNRVTALADDVRDSTTKKVAERTMRDVNKLREQQSMDARLFRQKFIIEILPRKTDRSTKRCRRITPMVAAVQNTRLPPKRNKKPAFV